MTTQESETAEDIQKKALLFSMNRHDAGYRINFEDNAAAMQGKCPIAWNDTHGGYWFVAGNQELFDLARRADVLSSDDDPFGVRRGYEGISIPPPPKEYRQGYAAPSFLAMDPPRQRHWRQSLNAYLSPAAVARWKPVLNEIVRATVDEFIEKGEVDFVDDLANIVPAIMTMGLLGWPLAEYPPFVEPTHAQVYTKPDDLEAQARLQESIAEMGAATLRLYAWVKETRNPGLVSAMFDAELAGGPAEDAEILGAPVAVAHLATVRMHPHPVPDSVRTRRKAVQEAIRVQRGVPAEKADEPGNEGGELQVRPDPVQPSH